MALDLIVRAGRVVDGGGGAPVTADIAVRSGAIVAVGRVRERAHRVIDADGALVLPGLAALDPPAIGFDRNARRHPAPGITTTIEVPEPTVAPARHWESYRRHLAGEPSLTNRLLLGDHDALRSEIMGNKVRDQLPPSPGDIDSMALLLAGALDAGFGGLRSAVAGAAGERRAILVGATRRTELRGEPPRFLTLVLGAGPSGDPAETRHEARVLLAADHGPGCVVVVSPTAIDDPEIVTALVGDDAVGILAALTTGNCIVGPGRNPLALVPAHRVDPTGLDLGTLVRSMASVLVAFGVEDRGRLATGQQADLNVIDLEHLAGDLASGMVSTIVAGVEVVCEDELTGEAPGSLLAPTGRR